MAFYRPSHRSSYTPSHHASGSYYPRFGLTYDPDGGFAAVDPFKPSVVYSIQNIWGPGTSNTDDLHDIPPIRRRLVTSSATGYPPGPIHSQHRPGTQMPYYSSIPGQPGPQPISQPPIVIQHAPPPWQHAQPVVVDSGSPARRSSPESRQSAIISMSPVAVGRYRSRSRSSSDRRRDRRRRSSSPRSRSGSRRQSPLGQRPPIVILPRSRSRSRSSSPYTRRRHRSRPRSLSPLALVQGGSILYAERPRRMRRQSRSSSRGRSPSPRKRVRYYTSRRSRSPVVVHGPKGPWSESATETVRPSNVVYLTPPGSMERHFKYSEPATYSRPSMYSQSSHRRRDFPVRAYVLAFIFDTLPRQIYLHFLLRLPHLYFSRVSRIFEEAEITMPKIKQGILETAAYRKDYPESTMCFELPTVQFGNLEMTWQYFIDSLMQEWQTLNIISVLLLSAILAIINITDAANDPLTRFAALMSMICALMSLVYGCLFIIRFGTMRKTYKAAEWAQESKKSRTSIFWNVWILLAMPAIWLAWSLISFIVCMISFVWRAGTPQDGIDRRLSRDQALIPRIFASCVFAIGFIYFILIVSTLRRYGSMMDLAWQARIRSWMSNSHYSGSTHRRGSHSYPQGSDISSTVYLPPVVYPSTPYAPTSFPPPTPTPHTQPAPYYSSSPPPVRVPHPVKTPVPPTVVVPFPASPPTLAHPLNSSDSGLNDQPQIREGSSTRGRNPNVKESFSPKAANRDKGVTNLEETKIRMTKLVCLSLDKEGNYSPTDEDLASCHVSKEKWAEMNEDILQAWDPDKLEALEEVLDRWNTIFNELGAQIALCEEYGDSLFQYAIYNFTTKDHLSHASHFQSIPQGLRELVILPVDEFRMHCASWNKNTHGITLRPAEVT